MSDDLIKRLRAFDVLNPDGNDLRQLAADEITRLRARLEQAERERDAALGEATGFSVRDYHDGKEAGFRAGIEAAATDLKEMATVLRMSGLQMHAHQADALEERANKVRALDEQKEA